jgi:nucleoside-diphosphate-sugar epimerase
VRIFLAGATGAIGRRLVPMLLAAGHEVTGSTRSPERAEQLRAGGAAAIVLDALDEPAVSDALAAAAPDAVIHQLTSIPQRINPRTICRDFEMNDRLRREGTRILVNAAQATGASRIIVQSIAFAYAPGPPGRIHDEGDPQMGPEDSPRPFLRSALALGELDRITLAAGGLVLRYGYFYGPGTAIAPGGSTGEMLAKRRFPVVGGGAGVWSFVHIDDAAKATVAALTRGASGAYNVVDDDPAPVSQWLPALAQALGARPPQHVPAWLARPLAGSYGIYTMTRAQGASNARAKGELGWTPDLPSWREGFRRSLSD